VLLDLDGAGLGAIDVERLWSVRPGTSIAVTRWLTSEADLVACVRAGALAYLPKELSAGALASAMHVVGQGMLRCPNLRQQLEPGGHEY
jgi:DNA-binding NarL/FixJ family response regulator